MVREGVQLAELRIRPPEMGLIEVRIAVSQQEASLAFAAQHSAVRDAIESALPRLREMLSEGGISLGNVDVSEHTLGRESHAPLTRFEGPDDWRGPPFGETEAAPLSEHVLLHHGLVDRYA
jgi:flagellar hook-length control protein FliK